MRRLLPGLFSGLSWVRRGALLLTVCSGSLAAQAQTVDAPPLIVPFGPVPPFMYRDTSGHRSGFFVELAEVIAREIGRPVEYLETKDAKGLVAAQNAGRSQMVAGIVRLPSLVEAHIYSDPVATDQLRYTVLVQNIQSFESAPVVSRRIGVVPSILGSEEPILAENTPVAFANVEAALFALLTQDVEALLIPPPTIFRLARNVGVDDQVIFGREVVGEIPRHVMLHRSRADLMPAINAAIARLEASGELGGLRQKFSLDVPPPEPAVLRVPIAHAPPYGILGEDGSVTGYAAEIFRDLAARAGLSIRFEPVSLDVYFSAVSSGSFDVIPFVLGSETLSPDLDLTIPIDSAALAIVVQPEEERFQNWTDLGDARVGSFPDTVGLAQQNGFPAAELHAFNTPDALATALEKGEIDAIMEVGHALSAEGLTDRFKSIGAPDLTVDNVIGLRPGLGAVRERLNAVIPGYLLSDDYALLRRTYFARQVFWTPTRLLHALGISLSALLVLALYQLRERQRQRQHAFARQAQELDREKAHSEALQMIVGQLEQANREQAEFTYAISHDLKSPANTIGLLIDALAEDSDLDEDSKTLLSDMARTNRHMRQLVDDVLAYSRLVGEPLVTKPVDLTQLMQDICGDLRADIEGANAVVETGPLPQIKGNRMQLRLLLQNLITNAIKFRAPDRPPKVQVTGRRGDRGSQLIVRDNGIGIPAEHRDRVFGLFQRLHSQTAFEGTGLGLSICKRVMSNHRGSIHITSGTDGGSAFVMTFPKDTA